MIGWIIIIFVALMVFVVVPFGIVMMLMSLVYNRRDRKLRGEAEAHRKILESTYDRIWKEIKSHCGLTEEHRRSFNNVYPNIIDKDMDDETMLNWILDCNIDFDPSEYPVVMEIIADDRQRFVIHQRCMLNVMRDHRALHGKKIAHWLVRNKSMIRYVPIETNYDRWGRGI